MLVYRPLDRLEHGVLSCFGRSIDITVLWSHGLPGYARG